MDSLSSARYYQDIRNFRRRPLQPLILYRRGRYRDRIWFLAPETWLALSFFLVVMGLSLINSGWFCAGDAERKPVMQFGAFLLLSGWAAMLFLLERTKSENWYNRPCTPYPRPAFVGVCIEPPIQREFLSAMLLPEVNREWTSAETIPGFEPRHAENVRPPAQQASVGEENVCEESRSKKRRNRKKKFNYSDLDSPPRDSNESSFVQIATSQEEGQSMDLTVYVLSSIVLEQENEPEFDKLNLESDQQSFRENNQFDESNLSENLDSFLSNEKDQIEHQSHTSSSFLNDSDKTNTSPGDKKAGKNQVSNYHHQDPLRTSDELIPEESYRKSEKTTLIPTADELQQEKSVSVTSLDHNSGEGSSLQLNKIPERFRNMIKPESDIPKAENDIRHSKDSEKPADQTVSSSTNSIEEVQTEAKPVSPEFITFISKKRNRRRKK